MNRKVMEQRWREIEGELSIYSFIEFWIYRILRQPLELVRLLLQYKWGTVFRHQWFLRIEELTKRNGKGVWMREIEKVLRRFDASLEWLMEPIEMRDEEFKMIKDNDEMGEREKDNSIITKSAKSVADVLEEVELLVDTHFFGEFSETKSFSEKVIPNQGEMILASLGIRGEHSTAHQDREGHQGDSGESPLCGEEEGAHHKEDGIKVLVQQDRAAAQRQSHCELLQESELRDQRKARHRRQYPPQQHPRPDRTDIQRAEVGREEDGENGQRRDHHRDGALAVRSVEEQGPGRRSEAEA